MTAMAEALAILDEAARLTGVRWALAHVADDAVGYVGTAPGWHIAVVKGWTDGRIVFDGAVAKGTTIVHMTREVAEVIWHKANKEYTP
jgi:hypothetical protein